jgi:hypothetical protein
MCVSLCPHAQVLRTQSSASLYFPSSVMATVNGSL